MRRPLSTLLRTRAHKPTFAQRRQIKNLFVAVVVLKGASVCALDFHAAGLVFVTSPRNFDTSGNVRIVKLHNRKLVFVIDSEEHSVGPWKFRGAFVRKKAARDFCRWTCGL